MSNTKSNKPSIFVYKMTHDNGGAPCVKNNLISLCICKPRIRKSARCGDWIIGVGAKSVGNLRDRLIFIMQVSDVISGRLYYAKKRQVF